jgi:hypothetical protein
MSLIKKIDVDKYFASRQAMRLGRTGPLSRSSAKIERTGKTTITAAFIEGVTPVPISADSEVASASTILRNRLS